MGVGTVVAGVLIAIGIIFVIMVVIAAIVGYSMNMDKRTGVSNKVKPPFELGFENGTVYVK
jgi:hypothetical protein